jgi:hypothetical protein
LASPINIILVRNGSCEIYWYYLGGEGLPWDLFWGPHTATVLTQSEWSYLDEDSRLTGYATEGGAVVDFDSRTLILFGALERLDCIQTRRVYLEMLQVMWGGWQVRWAYGGMADLAERVGHPLSDVIPKWDDEDTKTDVELLVEEPFISSVATVQREDGTLCILPLEGYAEDYLMAGPAILESIQRQEGVERLHFDEVPMLLYVNSGFHLNIPEKKIEFWLAYPKAGVKELITNRWPPGWSIVWHHDRYEFQLERAGGRLRFKEWTRQESEEHAKSFLLAAETENPIEGFVEWVERDVAEGRPVGKINPLGNDVPNGYCSWVVEVVLHAVRRLRAGLPAVQRSRSVPEDMSDDS